MFFLTYAFKIFKLIGTLKGFFISNSTATFYGFMPISDSILVVLAGIRTAVTAQDAHVKF